VISLRRSRAIRGRPIAGGGRTARLRLSARRELLRTNTRDTRDSRSHGRSTHPSPSRVLRGGAIRGARPGTRVDTTLITARMCCATPELPCSRYRQEPSSSAATRWAARRSSSCGPMGRSGTTPISRATRRGSGVAHTCAPAPSSGGAVRPAMRPCRICTSVCSHPTVRPSTRWRTSFGRSGSRSTASAGMSTGMCNPPSIRRPPSDLQSPSSHRCGARSRPRRPSHRSDPRVGAQRRSARRSSSKRSFSRFS